MKISLGIKPIKQSINRNIISEITGYFYNVIENDKNLHNCRSLFSLSNINGYSILENDKISYPKGGRIFIGAHNVEIIEKIIKNINKFTQINDSIIIEDIKIEKIPTFKEIYILNVRTPIWLYKYIEVEGKKSEKTFYSYDDTESNQILNGIMRNKLKSAGLEHLNLNLRFNTDYKDKKIKMVIYKDRKKELKLKTSFCPVIAEGDIEAIQFAWSVGLGAGTGMTFGSVK